MIKHGTRSSRVDHRDFDFFKSFGTIAPPTFPTEYFTDAGLWMPNQEISDVIQGLPTIPPLPYGCTDYTQSDLANDELGQLLRNPLDLDNADHANASGGIDIRTSLNAAIQLGWFKYYFNIQANTPVLDFFDAIRLAAFSGAPEKRSVSWGTPWYSEWENAAQTQSIMPSPQSYDPANLPWHNSKLCGWKTINEIPYLINKSWQGTQIGDKGFLYFPREVVNAVMAVSGSVAFTATQAEVANVQTIDVSVVQWIVSFMRNLLGYNY